MIKTVKKEIRTDLYTQSEYARKIGVSKSYVHKLVKERKIPTVTVNGAVLIKLV